MAGSTTGLEFGGFAAQRAQARRGDGAALHQAARQFETIFLQTLLKTANAVSFGDDGLGAHGDLVRDLRDRQLADQLSAGRGLGLADMLVRQLGGSPPPPVSGYAQGNLQRSPRVAHAQLRAMIPPPADFADPVDFVQALKPHAERAAAELGVSPKILLAQAALESNWGRQMPRTEHGGSSRNLFGIKAAGPWAGEVAIAATREVANGVEHSQVAGFRVYASFADSFADYVDFLRGNSRYAQALDHGGNDEKFLRGLKSAGYATDPLYVEKIQRVADSSWLDDAI